MITYVREREGDEVRGCVIKYDNERIAMRDDEEKRPSHRVRVMMLTS